MEIKQLETELKKASDGLLMMSETDEPFEFYYDDEHAGEELNEEMVLKLAGMPAHYPVQVVALDYFLRNMTRTDTESGEAQRQQARRFQELQARLQELLRDVKAYKVGENRISVFILGKTDSGEIAGLKTVVVET